MTPTVANRRPYSRHGLTALRAKINVRGLGVLDKRTAAARLLLAWRNDLMADMGGEATLSAQRRALIELSVRTRLYVESLDAWLLAQPSLLAGKGKRKTVLPVLLERQRLADSLANLLGRLGLDRRVKPVQSLNDYLKARNGEHVEDAHEAMP